MQEHNQYRSGRSTRPYRSYQDSESKLEQIKREVKSWFSDDDNDDRGNDYDDNRDRYQARDQGRYAGSRGAQRFTGQDERSFDSPGYLQPGNTRENEYGDYHGENYVGDRIDRDRAGNRGYSSDDYPSSGRFERARSSQRSDGDYVRYGNDYYRRDHDQGFNNSDRASGSMAQPGHHTYSQNAFVPGPYAGTGPKGYQRSSESLKESVCDRLENDGRVNASEIEVEVDKCEVTLSGTVPNREQKRLAEVCVEGVRGVRDVHNRLRVDSNNRSSSSNLDTGSIASASSDGSPTRATTGRRR